MGLLDKKAFRDLFGDRGRILSVFLAMVLGTAVFGTFTFTRATINREIDAEYSAMAPASASVLVSHVDDGLLGLLEQNEAISGYEVGATYELAMVRPDGTMKKVQLFSSPDYEQRAINKIKPVEGSFAPQPGEVLLDSGALGVADAKLGDTISIRLPDDTMRDYTISGTVNDLSQHPPAIHDEVYVYVSPDTLGEMGLAMNRIDYLLAGEAYDRTRILDVSQALIGSLEEAGYSVGTIHVSNTPGVSMHKEEYAGALFIFQVFSVVAFLFGCIIMSSLFSTLLAGQVKQIGILKSMGAKTPGIIRSYLGAALALIACNLAAALPLSYLAAKGLSSFFMSIGNMKIHNFALPWELLLIVCAGSVVVPLLLALVPIRRGLKVTVKDAVNDIGIPAGQVSGTRLTGALEMKLSRPVLFSVRGAMAGKRRFAMNVSLLTLGGLMFVGILGSIISINMALTNSMDAQLYDYQIITSQPVDAVALENAVRDEDGVVSYEVWGETSGQLVYSGGNTGNSFGFAAVPADTELYSPRLMEGRWLEPGDTNAIVVSFEFFRREPGFALGSKLTFQFAGAAQEFEIVGVINEIGDSKIYLSEDGFAQYVPRQARRGSINIVTPDVRGRKTALYHQISHRVTESGVSILQATSKADRQSIQSSHFTTTLTSFLVVAILAVIVAGFGLATTMSVRVNERTREIGILKAIGATKKQVFSIITAESTFTALFGFALCLLLGIPVTALAIQIIGVSILEIPLSLSPAVVALALAVWLAVTCAIGRLASRKAAQHAVRLTVKEAIA